MIKKLSLLLPGAIALALTVAPVLPAFSQSTTTPNAPQMHKHRGGMNKLNLTDDQKARLKQIRESSRAQIESVLTDEQKSKLQAMKQQRQAMRQQGQSMRQQGQRGKGVWASLNLTDDQKARIREIRENAKTQRNAVLTSEQRQQLEQMHQQWRQRRQQAQPST